MKWILTTLVVAMAAMVAGCGQKEVPRPTLPSTSEMFDKKEVPNKGRDRGAAPN
jgi:hypothetical protein